MVSQHSYREWVEGAGNVEEVRVMVARRMGEWELMSET